MKSNITRILALLLALVMVVGTLAACDTTEPQQTTDPNAGNQTQPTETDPVETEPQLEPVTLKWMIRASEKEGSEDVEAAFNELLATVLPNTTVDFIYGGGSKYGENWTMMLSGGETIDMAWCGYSNPLLADVVDGNVLPLDDLIAQYAPNIQADSVTFENAYFTGKYDGQQYYIPCVQPVVKAVQTISMEEEFFEKYFDYDAFLKEIRSHSKLTYKMLDIIEDAFAAAVADGYLVPGDLDSSFLSGLTLATMGYCAFGEENYHLWFDPEAEVPEVMHVYELPETQMLLDRYAKWYDMGWYSDAQILGQNNTYGKGQMTVPLAATESWAGRDENGLRRNDNSAQNRRNTVSIALQREDEVYVGTTAFGLESTYWGIAYTAKNPERAMMLINLLHDAEGTVGNQLWHLVAYGFAKDSPQHQKYGWFNYALGTSADGQPMVDTSARGDAPNMHSVYDWTMANTYRAITDGSNTTSVANKEYCLNYYTDVYPQLRRTPVAGMLADTSGVVEELGAMAAVEAEYSGQLGYGVAGQEGIDELYDKVMAAMYVAGLNIIKGEFQDQIEAWMANNK